MKNSHNKKFEETNILGTLQIIGILGLLFILVSFSIYYLHIIINENNDQPFGTFGDYFGGVLSPILAFAALIALLVSIYYQVSEFQKSTKQLKVQNELIHQQMQEAINYRIKEAEMKKIDATNKLIIQAINCFNKLLAVKDNYRKEITADPIQRVSCIRPIIMNYQIIEPNFSDLHFLTKISSKYKPDSPANIIFISMVFANFNSLLSAWKKRNEEIMPIFEQVIKNSPGTSAFATYSPSELTDLIGKPKIAQLINLTEHCISQTDQCILGFKEIFSELPEIVESLISTETLESYGRIVRYQLSEDVESVTQEVISIDENACIHYFK